MSELQAVQDFLAIPEIVAVVVEVELHVAQTEDGDRANVGETRDAEKNRLDRDGDLALHFFGGPGRILGDDFDKRRRRIGIGFDVQARERSRRRATIQAHESHDHQRAVTQQRSDQGAHRADLVLARGAKQKRILGDDRVAGIEAVEQFPANRRRCGRA